MAFLTAPLLLVFGSKKLTDWNEWIVSLPWWANWLFYGLVTVPTTILISAFIFPLAGEISKHINFVDRLKLNIAEASKKICENVNVPNFDGLQRLIIIRVATDEPLRVLTGLALLVRVCQRIADYFVKSVVFVAVPVAAVLGYIIYIYAKFVLHLGGGGFVVFLLLSAFILVALVSVVGIFGILSHWIRAHRLGFGPESIWSLAVERKASSLPAGSIKSKTIEWKIKDLFADRSSIWLLLKAGSLHSLLCTHPKVVARTVDEVCGIAPS